MSCYSQVSGQAVLSVPVVRFASLRISMENSAEHLNPQNIVDPESASNSVDPADAIGRVILHGACLKTSSRPGQSVSPRRPLLRPFTKMYFPGLFDKSQFLTCRFLSGLWNHDLPKYYIRTLVIGVINQLKQICFLTWQSLGRFHWTIYS